jgi:hypothetical protein
MSSCSNQNNSNCSFNIKGFGVDDVTKVSIDGSDITQLNWSEISVPEILNIPTLKPDIENLDQVYVDVDLTCVKLIETPFAYKVYDRYATTFELTTAGAAVNLALAVDIAPVIAAVNAILAIPLLPAIPAVTALQAALAAVVTADANLTVAINAAVALINSPCSTAAALVLVLEAVIDALNILVSTLNALVVAALALIVAVTAILPAVGALVATAVNTVLIPAINVVLTQITAALTALLNSIALIGNTKYFGIISNEEGTCLSGRKLIVEGVLKQKVVYTALVSSQSVHSACFEMPFSAYILPYAKFEGLMYQQNVTVVLDQATCSSTTINGFAFDPNNPIVVDLCEEFNVNAYIEDIFAAALSPRTVFKNITLFLLAKPLTPCS